MIVIVLPAQVVDVGGADKRSADLAGNAGDSSVRLVLLRDAVVLELEGAYVRVRISAT